MTIKSHTDQSVNGVQELDKPIDKSAFDALPDGGYIRISQLATDSKRPDFPAPIPFSAPTVWRKVREGTFPAPVKLSARVTCWSVRSIREWLRAQSEASYVPRKKPAACQQANV